MIVVGTADIDYIGPNGTMYTSQASGARPAAATKLIQRGVIGCALAVALAGAVYVNALHNPFVYDDYRIIVENQSLRDLSNLRAVLWHEVTRPGVNVSYAVDRAIWGPGPFGFHLTSVVLHMINVGLFGLLAWCAASDWRAASDQRIVARPAVVAVVSSLFFAVHPMMTEAVGYISGRSEVLCAMFFLLAFLSARAWMHGGGRRWLVAAVAFWVAALGSKEIAAMFPFAMLAYDRLVSPGAPDEARRRWRQFHLPLFGIAAVLVIVRLAIFQFVEHGGGVRVQWSYALVEFDVVRQYLSLIALPVGQAIFHATRPVTSVLDPRALAGIGAVCLVLVLAWRLRHRLGGASFGLIWFLLLLVPSSALVVLDRGEPMAEHRVYLASCGLFLLAGFVVDRSSTVLARGRRRANLILSAVLVAVVASLAGLTLVRNGVWSEPVMVWLEAAERAPDQWLPNLLLGEELHRSGQHEQAVAAFRRVVQLRPQEAAAYGKLGVCLSELGDLAGAQAAFERQGSLDPASPEVANGLAVVALLSGRVDEAKRRYQETLRGDPSNVGARRGLAVIAETAGSDPAEALRLCEEIRQLAPDTPGIDDCISRNRAKLGGGRDGNR